MRSSRELTFNDRRYKEGCFVRPCSLLTWNIHNIWRQGSVYRAKSLGGWGLGLISISRNVWNRRTSDGNFVTCVCFVMFRFAHMCRTASRLMLLWRNLQCTCLVSCPRASGGSLAVARIYSGIKKRRAGGLKWFSLKLDAAASMHVAHAFSCSFCFCVHF